MSKVDPHFVAASAPAESTAGDQALACRLVQGDGRAWQTFVQKYGRLIRARVADVAASFGRGRDESAIDDATADVLAALLHKNASALRSFSGRSSLATYVAVISTRTATRGFAAQQKAATIDQTTAECLDPADEKGGDPSRRILIKERQAHIQRVIKSLPPKQREAVSLFHLQGCSYVEVSQKMQIPLGSVGVTLRRAEAKLKELLEPD